MKNNFGTQILTEILEETKVLLVEDYNKLFDKAKLREKITLWAENQKDLDFGISEIVDKDFKKLLL